MVIKYISYILSLGATLAKPWSPLDLSLLVMPYRLIWTIFKINYKIIWVSVLILLYSGSNVCGMMLKACRQQSFGQAGVRMRLLNWHFWPRWYAFPLQVQSCTVPRWRWTTYSAGPKRHWPASKWAAVRPGQWWRLKPTLLLPLKQTCVRDSPPVSAGGQR